MEKSAAIYIRVSSKEQSTKSQEPDLERWASSHHGPVKWYRDKASGKTMDRPGWRELEEDMRAGKVSKIVCWKLDRLGRTACELLSLRNELVERKVDLQCVMSGVTSLDSAEGRMMFTVIASFAEFEREIRSERQAAGIAKARAEGKYPGRRKGSFKAKNGPNEAHRLRKKGNSVNQIARSLGVSRNTAFIYLRKARGTTLPCTRIKDPGPELPEWNGVKLEARPVG